MYLNKKKLRKGFWQRGLEKSQIPLLLKSIQHFGLNLMHFFTVNLLIIWFAKQFRLEKTFKGEKATNFCIKGPVGTVHWFWRQSLHNGFKFILKASSYLRTSAFQWAIFIYRTSISKNINIDKKSLHCPKNERNIW